MNALAPAIGAALILTALYDIFHTLFHPMGHGGLSGFVMRSVWKACRVIGKRKPRLITFAGALIFGAVILTWAAMLWFGFALIYAPLLKPGTYDGPRFAEALFRSACYLTTYSSSIPFEHEHLFARLLVPLESAFGLAVATASISWVMEMQPILRHRRGFAHGMRAVFDAIDDVGGMEKVPRGELAGMLGRIAREVLQIRSDFRHTPGAYYFHADDEQMSLVAILPRLIEFAHEAEKRDEPEVKLRAKMLLRAVDNLASTIREHFLDEAPRYEKPERTVERWRKDHLEEGA